MGITASFTFDAAQHRNSVLKGLMGVKGGKVLVLHPAAKKQPELFHLFTEFLVEKYKVSPINAKIYLKRVFPQTDILDPEADNKETVKNKSMLKNKSELTSE